MKITILIPVYKEPKRVSDIVSKLLANDYTDKVLVVIVDGNTNPAIEAALEPHRAGITVNYNGEQLGKTESINRVAHKIRTDVFLMLDNDIELPDDPLFLQKIAVRMEHNDLIEIPKEGIRKSLVSRMMSIEFLSFAMISLTMGKLAKRSPSMNGAAFAVTALLFRQLDGFQPVINEDMDFAARAFQLHSAFAYPPELKVRNDVPDSISEWLVQRKRWAMNNILWFKENFFLIFINLFKTPAMFFSTILLMLPFITYLLVFMFIQHTGIVFLLPLLFMVTQHFQVITGIFLWLIHVNLISSGSWIASIAGVLVAGAVFAVFARILRFRFNPLDFLLYYFIYSPIWMLANVIMFFVVLFKIDIKIDWKISKS